MQTPYEILKGKEKKRRKNLAELKEKKVFDLIYERNPINSSPHQSQQPLTSSLGNQNNSFQKQAHSQKFAKIRRNKSQSDKHSHTEKRLQDQQHQTDSIAKNYQIIFRQSIKKANDLRKKVYHNQATIKKNNLLGRFFESHSRKNKQISLRQNNSQKIEKMLNQNKNTRRDLTKRSQHQQENLRYSIKNSKKFKRLLRTIDSQRSNRNYLQEEPGYEMEGINTSLKTGHCKVNQWFQEGFPDLLLQKCSVSKQCVDSQMPVEFVEQKENRNEEYSQSGDPQYFPVQNFKRKKNQSKNFYSTCSNQGSNYRWSFLSKPETWNKCPKQEKKTQEQFVANFIKYKKKNNTFLGAKNAHPHHKYQTIPETWQPYKSSNTWQPDRVSISKKYSDEFEKKQKSSSLMQELRRQFYSPNKSSRKPYKIKINSLQSNISAWETLESIGKNGWNEVDTFQITSQSPQK